MLIIRLRRTGKKHDPSFKVVVTDSKEAAKSGGFLELLGHVDSGKSKPVLNAERIKYWISKGAQVSDTANNLLIREKIISGKKRDVLHHDKIKAKLEKNKKPEEKPAEEAPATEVPTVEAPAEETNTAPEAQEELTQENP